SGANNYHSNIARNGVRNKVFCPVNNPVVAVLYCSGAHSSRIRTRVVFGKPPSANVLPARKFWNPALFLLFVSKSKNVICAKGIVCGHRKPDGRIYFRKFIYNSDIFLITESGTSKR